MSDRYRGMPGACAGLSIVEFMIVCAMLAIMLNVAMPALRDAIDKSASGSMARQFMHALALGRQSAIEQGAMVSFCGSHSGRACDGDFRDGSIVFVDFNANAVLDAEDKLLRQLGGNSGLEAIHWRSFRNRRYLQLTPMGFTNNQSGNFSFCPAGGGLEQAAQIIINRAGRFRLATDEDGDGIADGAGGKAIRCD